MENWVVFLADAVDYHESNGYGIDSQRNVYHGRDDRLVQAYYW